MKSLKKTAAAFLSAALILTGCAGADTSWAFESGGTRIPTGLYITNQIMSFAEAEQKLYEENMSNADFKPPAKASDMLKMNVEGTNASEWINEKAKKQVREYIAVKQKFESMNLALSESEINALDRNTKNVLSENKGFYENNGVSESSLNAYYTGFAEKSMLFQELYKEGGEFGVPEDTLKDYFADNYAQIELLPIPKYMAAPEGETKTVEQLNEELKAEAESYLKRLQDGEDITDLVYEYERKYASDDEKDNIKKPEKKAVSRVLNEDMRYNFGDALTDAVLNASVGDCGLADDSEFYAVYKRVDIMADASAFETYKTDVLNTLKYEEFNGKIAEWAAALQVESNDAALNKYKPSRIEFPSAK